MNEKELIEAVARLWVDNNGDADGIFWSINRLRDAVEVEIKRRSNDQ